MSERICPKCKRLYDASITICPDCDVLLAETDSDFEKVISYIGGTCAAGKQLE